MVLLCVGVNVEAEGHVSTVRLSTLITSKDIKYILLTHKTNCIYCAD